MFRGSAVRYGQSAVSGPYDESGICISADVQAVTLLARSHEVEEDLSQESASHLKQKLTAVKMALMGTTSIS